MAEGANLPPAPSHADLELYRAIVASMLEGVAVIRRADATIVWANERLTAMLGRAAGSLVDEPARVLLTGTAEAGPPGESSPVLTALNTDGSWEGLISVRTGPTLPGRGTFQDDLTRELSRARRTNEPVSVAMLSLDGNLDFGNSETIDVLARATQAWRQTLRDSDSIAYYDFGDFDYVILL